MLRVHFTPGDGKGWAIDEDLRQIRIALRGHIRESLAAAADVIYCPFWGNLSHYPKQILRDRFVICHADNPPIFYITQGYFAEVQPLVDLWIARSREALEQFQALRLPVEYVPYTTDPDLFFPLDSKKTEGLRKKYGLDETEYLIANFHRDSEGSDLNRPKAQKSPEMLIEIARELKRKDLSFRLLLAGPRRHWLRRECQRNGIPYAFVGDEKILGDDFGKNILTREALNELYAIANLYVVPSRWEGGPQSIMEAAAAHCPVLSTRVGLAMDLLAPECLFQTAEDAAQKIARDITEPYLTTFVAPHAENFHQNHTTAAMIAQLPGVLHSREAIIHKKHKVRTLFSLAREVSHQVRRRLPRQTKTRAICLLHEDTGCAEMNDFVARIQDALSRTDVELHDASSQQSGDHVLLGCWKEPIPAQAQLMAGSWHGISPELPAIVPSMAEAVRLRKLGLKAPMVALPFYPMLAIEEELPGWQIIAENEDAATEKIWAALSRRVPVLYPVSQPYRGLVYHGGIAYGSAKDLREKQELRFASIPLLGWIPPVKECVRELCRVLEAE